MIQYSSHMTIRPWFYILRGGGTLMQLEPSGTPSVVCRVGDKLKMSFRGKFRDPGDAVKWPSDRLQVGVDIGGKSYPLGIYIITTASKSHEETGDYVNLQGYSMLYLASRKKIEGRCYFAAGTEYMAVVREALAMAGIDEVDVDACDSVLATEREWEAGTTILDIVNELLSEINFREAYPDMKGILQIRKKKEPEPENVTMAYPSGEYSVLFEPYTVEQDGFDKPNVFRFVCTNPEMNTEMVAEAVNDDPRSPFSTVNVGDRILEINKVDNVPDLATLQEMAVLRMRESRRSAVSIKFTSAIQPEHGVYDILHLDHGEAAGIYEELEWTIQVGAAGKMTHKAERVILE